MSEVNTYKTTTDGAGKVRFFINGGQCPTVIEYCARYFHEFGACPTDANVYSGNPLAALNAVRASTELVGHPHVAAKIWNFFGGYKYYQGPGSWATPPTH